MPVDLVGDRGARGKVSRYREPTAEDLTSWKEWVASRPPNVRVWAEKFEPWTLYRMKSTGHRVTLHSFNEAKDGTVTLRVNVTGQFNLVSMERRVFGIDPNDLEECELPKPDEPVGSANLSVSEVRAMIQAKERVN